MFRAGPLLAATTKVEDRQLPRPLPEAARSEALLAEIEVEVEGGDDTEKASAFVVASPDGSLLAVVSASRVSLHALVQLESGDTEPSATVSVSDLDDKKAERAETTATATTAASFVAASFQPFSALSPPRLTLLKADGRAWDVDLSRCGRLRRGGGAVSEAPAPFASSGSSSFTAVAWRPPADAADAPASPSSLLLRAAASGSTVFVDDFTDSPSLSSPPRRGFALRVSSRDAPEGGEDGGGGDSLIVNGVAWVGRRALLVSCCLLEEGRGGDPASSSSPVAPLLLLRWGRWRMKRKGGNPPPPPARAEAFEFFAANVLPGAAPLPSPLLPSASLSAPDDESTLPPLARSFGTCLLSCRVPAWGASVSALAGAADEHVRLVEYREEKKKFDDDEGKEEESAENDADETDGENEDLGPPPSAQEVTDEWAALRLPLAAPHDGDNFVRGVAVDLRSLDVAVAHPDPEAPQPPPQPVLFLASSDGALRAFSFGRVERGNEGEASVVSAAVALRAPPPGTFSVSVPEEEEEEEEDEGGESEAPAAAAAPPPPPPPPPPLPLENLEDIAAAAALPSESEGGWSGSDDNDDRGGGSGIAAAAAAESSAAASSAAAAAAETTKERKKDQSPSSSSSSAASSAAG